MIPVEPVLEITKFGMVYKKKLKHFILLKKILLKIIN